MNDIIPPSMADKANVVISYMSPIRHDDGSRTIEITIHATEPEFKKVANCEFRVRDRDWGIALADAIRAVVLKEIPPEIHKPNGN